MPAAQSRIVRECHRYSAQADAIAAEPRSEFPIVSLLYLGVAPVRSDGNALSILFHNYRTPATGFGRDDAPSLRTEHVQRSRLC
jgi:hypothetical protein